MVTQEATRKRSEGEATAKVEMARAEKVSLETIAEAIETDGCSQTEYMLSKRYNELLRAAPASTGKTMFVPYEVGAISGLIASLSDVYGRDQSRRTGSRRVASRSPAPPPGSGGGARVAGSRTTGAAAVAGSDAYPDLG